MDGTGPFTYHSRPDGFGDTIPVTRSPRDLPVLFARPKNKIFAESPNACIAACPARRRARRQIRSRLRSRLPDRRASVRPAPHPAATARQAGRPQHRRLRFRLPRLAARRTGPVAVEGAEVSRPREHQVPAGPERGPRGHVDLGHAAGESASRCQGRWRVLDVVRQGSRRGPLRRRVQAREFRGHVEARRRAGAGRRRSRCQVFHAAPPVRPHVLRGDDAGAVPVLGAGNPRPRPARLGDVALLGLLGRLQVRRGHGREFVVRVRRSGARQNNHSR